MKRQIKGMRPDNKTKACNNEVPVSVNSFSQLLSCSVLGLHWVRENPLRHTDKHADVHI